MSVNQQLKTHANKIFITANWLHSTSTLYVLVLHEVSFNSALIWFVEYSFYTRRYIHISIPFVTYRNIDGIPHEVKIIPKFLSYWFAPFGILNFRNQSDGNEISWKILLLKQKHQNNSIAKKKSSFLKLRLGKPLSVFRNRTYISFH